MSQEFGWRTRTDRLLPIHDDTTLRSVQGFRILAIPATSSSAPLCVTAVSTAAFGGNLPPSSSASSSTSFPTATTTQQQHVHQWWRSPREEKNAAYKHWLKADVLPTRIPVQMGFFPPVQTVGNCSSTPNLDQTSPHRSSSANNNSKSSSGQNEKNTALERIIVPCAAVQHHVPLLSQYEKLVCPSLLCSPLYSPIIEITAAPCTDGGGDNEVDATTVSSSTSSCRDVGRVKKSSSPLHWSTQFIPGIPLSTARLLQTLAKRAFVFCIPVHEVTLFFSLALLYLDAVAHFQRWGYYVSESRTSFGFCAVEETVKRGKMEKKVRNEGGVSPTTQQSENEEKQEDRTRGTSASLHSHVTVKEEHGGEGKDFSVVTGEGERDACVGIGTKRNREVDGSRDPRVKLEDTTSILCLSPRASVCTARGEEGFRSETKTGTTSALEGGVDLPLCSASTSMVKVERLDDDCNSNKHNSNSNCNVFNNNGNSNVNNAASSINKLKGENRHDDTSLKHEVNENSKPIKNSDGAMDGSCAEGLPSAPQSQLNGTVFNVVIADHSNVEAMSQLTNKSANVIISQQMKRGASRKGRGGGRTRGESRTKQCGKNEGEEKQREDPVSSSSIMINDPHESSDSSHEVSFAYFSSAMHSFKQQLMEICVDKDSFVSPTPAISPDTVSDSHSSSSVTGRKDPSNERRNLDDTSCTARVYNFNPQDYRGPCTSTAAAMILLLMAADELEQRHSETVTSAFPIGCGLCGAAWSPREIIHEWEEVLGDAQEDDEEEEREETDGEEREEEEGVGQTRGVSSSSSHDNGARRRMREGAGDNDGQRRAGGRANGVRNTVGGNGRGRGGGRGGGGRDEEQPCFIPFTARRTPRNSHFFHLPPLPKDPVELFFLPLWERVLKRCLTVRGALPNLREELLQESSQQWKSVVRADDAIRQRNLKRMERHQQEQRRKDEWSISATDFEPSSGLCARAVAAAESKARAASGLGGLPAGPAKEEEGENGTTLLQETESSAHSREITHNSKGRGQRGRLSDPPTSISASVRVEDGTIESMGLRQTSFVIRAPVEWNWRWTPALVPVERSSPLPLPSPSSPSSSEGSVLLHRFMGWRGGEGKVLQYGMPAGTPLRHIERYAISPFTDAVFSLSSGGPFPPPPNASIPSVSSSYRRNVPPPQATGTPTVPLGILYTVEELSDFLCRVGAPMRRAADPSALLILSRPQVGFVRAVLQRERPDLFLSSSAQGMMEWRVRASSRTVALLHLTNSGIEARLGIPAQLSLTSTVLHPKRRGGTVAAQRHTEESLQSALREVWRGGLNEALAYVRFLYRVRSSERESCTTGVEVLRLYGISQDAGIMGTSSGVMEQRQPPSGSIHFLGRLDPVRVSSVAGKAETAPLELPVIVLRRTEESAVYRILQSHPNVIELLGCGAQQLLLGASDGRLILRRKCGTVVSWSLEDCYQPGTGLRRPLREPRRAIRVPYPLPLPVELQQPQQPHQEQGDLALSSSRSGAATATGSSIHRPLLVGLLAHYFKSLRLDGKKLLRQDKNWFYEREQIPSGTFCEAGIPTTASKSVKNEEEKRDENRIRKKPPTSGSQEEEEERQEEQGVESLHLDSYYPRTVLFPTDRALVLFVLRHHPTYYTTIRRCGIKEIYVSWEASSCASGNLIQSENSHHGDNQNRGDPLTRYDGSSSSHATNEGSSNVKRPEESFSLPQQEGVELHPVLVVEYTCGLMLPCYTWEECFSSSFPFSLQGYQRMV